VSAKRKEIRKELVKLLRGRTRAQSNVRANRSEANWFENLPAINIYMRNEELEETDQAPRRLTRNLFVEIEIVDKGKDGDELSDKIDDRCEQVERILSIDDTLSDKANDIVLSNCDFEMDASGKEPIGKATLTYKIPYYDYFPRDQKDQGISELAGIDTDWRIGHHNDEPSMVVADSAKDEIDLPL